MHYKHTHTRTHATERVMTVYYCLDDVDVETQRGSIIFPRGQIKVVPQKGLAIVWHTRSVTARPISHPAGRAV